MEEEEEAEAPLAEEEPKSDPADSFEDSLARHDLVVTTAAPAIDCKAKQLLTWAK